MNTFYFFIQFKSVKGHGTFSVANWVFDSEAESSRRDDQHSKFDHRILGVSRSLRFCAFVFMCDVCTCVSSAEVCNQAC